MAGSPLAVRTLTVVAVGVLAFDGAALAVGGVWARNLPLGIVGVCLFLSSGLVLWYVRRHRRRLAEIAAARRGLREEAEALRALVRRN